MLHITNRQTSGNQGPVSGKCSPSARRGLEFDSHLPLPGYELPQNNNKSRIVKLVIVMDKIQLLQ